MNMMCLINKRGTNLRSKRVSVTLRFATYMLVMNGVEKAQKRASEFTENLSNKPDVLSGKPNGSNPLGL